MITYALAGLSENATLDDLLDQVALAVKQALADKDKVKLDKGEQEKRIQNVFKSVVTFVILTLRRGLGLFVGYC